VRVIRRPAVQGHAIPTTAHQPRGPWPSEVMAPNPVEPVEPNDPDPRATAQNGYRVPTYLRCTSCGSVIEDTEAASHHCPGEET
jgi:hypothetical protein